MQKKKKKKVETQAKDMKGRENRNDPWACEKIYTSPTMKNI